jgi:hypothetical protein
MARTVAEGMKSRKGKKIPKKNLVTRRQEDPPENVATVLGDAVWQWWPVVALLVVSRGESGDYVSSLELCGRKSCRGGRAKRYASFPVSVV